jgi:hypothetical protein
MNPAGSRFVCSDPDVGDLEFADVEAVLDALEAALVEPTTPLFDAVRQTRQAVGLHPEVRAAWEARLRFRPPSGVLTLPELPTITALVRSLPSRSGVAEVADPAITPIAIAVRRHRGRGKGAPGSRRALLATLLAAAVLLLAVGWVVITVAGRVTNLAAGAAGFRPR